MSKLFRRILCVGLVMAIVAASTIAASAASAADFTDVKPTAWYYGAVDYAARENLFAGTGNGKFSPNVGMTRGMFVTVLGRRAGVSDAKPFTSRFSDVQVKDYFSPYTEWAAKYDIVSGTGNGRFSPNDRITREQMAAMLYRYAKLTGGGDILNGTEILRFPDTGDVSNYAKEAMTWAVDKGIINGSDGRLDPKGTATRAQVAQVFLNAKDVLTKMEISEPDVPTLELFTTSWAEDQNPYEILRVVLNESNARWDTSLNAGNAFSDTVIDFVDWGSSHQTASWAAFNVTELLNNTGADRFYMKEELFNGVPSQTITLYFTIPDKEDSALMKAAREIIEKKFPNAQFKKMGGVHGWRGSLQADSSLTLAENAQRVANQEIRYLSEWNSESDSFSYWISEPRPGVFYFFY